MNVERNGWIITAEMALECGNCGMKRPLPYGVKATCGCGAVVEWHIPTPEEWERLNGSGDWAPSPPPPEAP